MTGRDIWWMVIICHGWSSNVTVTLKKFSKIPKYCIPNFQNSCHQNPWITKCHNLSWWLWKRFQNRKKYCTWQPGFGKFVYLLWGFELVQPLSASTNWIGEDGEVLNVVSLVSTKSDERLRSWLVGWCNKVNNSFELNRVGASSIGGYRMAKVQKFTLEKVAFGTFQAETDVSIVVSRRVSSKKNN